MNACPRESYDYRNDPYNYLPGKREDYPCTCGNCPEEGPVYGGICDYAGTPLSGYTRPLDDRD